MISYKKKSINLKRWKSIRVELANSREEHGEGVNATNPKAAGFFDFSEPFNFKKLFPFSDFHLFVGKLYMEAMY